MNELSHTHTDSIIVDADEHFTIDTTTRSINCTTNKKLKLMQFDHNSERYSFDIDRIIDGHDLLDCDRVQIHFINIGSSREKHPGLYLVDDVQVMSTDKNKLTFTWLISQDATSLEGVLSFLVSFECTDGDKILYRWSSDKSDSIKITVGMDNDNTIVELYADELLAWENYMQTEFIPDLVDKCYVEREFATSEEVAQIFDISNPDGTVETVIIPFEEITEYVDKAIVDNVNNVVDDKLGDYVTKDSIDSVPTADSENLVTSGGIKTYVDENIENVLTQMPTGGIKHLVGTEEKPINLATDMEVGELYSLNGNVLFSKTEIKVPEKLVNPVVLNTTDGRSYLNEFTVGKQGGVSERFSNKVTEIPNLSYVNGDMVIFTTGWIGASSPIVEAGYCYDNNEATLTFDSSFIPINSTTNPTSGTVNTIQNATGLPHVATLSIRADLSTLASGDRTLYYVVKLENGTIVKIAEISLTGYVNSFSDMPGMVSSYEHTTSTIDVPCLAFKQTEDKIVFENTRMNENVIVDEFGVNTLVYINSDGCVTNSVTSNYATKEEVSNAGFATLADIEAAIGNVSALLGDTEDLEV